MNDEKRYGWYSQRANEVIGSVYYATPSGEEVACSFISRSATDHGAGWHDAVLVGEVTEYRSLCPKRRARVEMDRFAFR